LAEQREGLHPSGDFGRLMTFLSRELAATRRAGIRKANLLELLDQGLRRGIDLVTPALGTLDDLEDAVVRERRKLGAKMAENFGRELLACRTLWERRLLAQVTQSWGMSPFAGLLRMYQAQVMLLSTWWLFRSRSTAQMALWGAWQGAKWLGERQSLQAEEERLSRLTDFGIDPAEFRSAQVTLAGYVHAAQLHRDSASDERLDGEAAVAAAFLNEASQKLNRLVDRAASRNSGWWTRLRYEALFLIFPAFLIYRIGRNYFYDSFWLDKPLLDLNFYIPSALFLFLWGAAFLWRFVTRLRRGVQSEIEELTRTLSESAAWDELFRPLSVRCRRARDQVAQLQSLETTVQALRQSLEDDSRLGGRHARV
jgi:hypothetical protein